MEGKEITKMYLHAAGQSFNMEKFQYTKEIHDGMNSVLEFETYIDDISVNGVDMIEWNEDGKISNFKVMIRPNHDFEVRNFAVFIPFNHIHSID